MGLLLFVRHGQASFGDSDYDRLSALGIEQSRLAGARLATSALAVDRVVRGRMRRQIETVDAIGTHLDLARIPVSELPGLDEYDHSDILAEQSSAFIFDPTSASARTQASAAMDVAVTRWARGQGTYVESHAAFCARVATTIDALAALPGTTVAVSSGGVISAAAAALLGESGAGWEAMNRVMANASMTKVVLGRSGRSLVTFNDHAHLEHERRLITYR